MRNLFQKPHNSHIHLLLFTWIAAVIASFTGQATPVSAQSDSVERPNIIILMTDQQSASMMSVTGNEHLDTPEMDRIARSGVRFERAYVTNPVCYPARFSLMTGRMPSAAGIHENGDSIQNNATRFQKYSMGRLFSKNGYKLAYGGKTHLPEELNPGRIGFNVLTGNERNKLARKAAKYVKKDHEKPFLLYANFIQPHDICFMAINAYRRARKGKDLWKGKGPRIARELLEPMRNKSDKYIQENTPPLPDNHAVPEREPVPVQKRYVERRPFRNYVRKNWTERDWRLHRWLYARLTERLDRQIGMVMDAVREAGIAEDTMIVLTSEHGDHDASHKLEHKSIPYEEAARVPMVVSWKNHIEGGQVDQEHLVSNGLDLLPTLLDYADIPVPDHLHGRSLRPLLENREVNWRESLVVETRIGRMIRTDRFKYVVYQGKENVLRDRLTDLKNDPGEMNNLVSDPRYREELNRLRTRLIEWTRKINGSDADEYLIPPN